jgi:hypothetical protein
MAQVRADGVAIGLPHGWEGQIRHCDEDPNVAVGRADAVPGGEVPVAGDVGTLSAPEIPPPRVLLHAANFALPADRGDYGSGAVEAMGRRHVFVSLIEFDRSDAGSALFARTGVPRRLRAGDFDPNALQRPLPGQGGHQSFFTEAGRAFCLYVVIGSYRLAGMLVPVVNDILATIEIDER